jgi:pSer/pThr/pTyr-binding forkhead associated (FHA) protein
MAHKFLRVGRGEKNKDGLKNDIKLTHESISRSHLEVFIDEEGNVFITDLDTKNGTFVNGHPVVGDTKLNHGDILKLGVGRPVQWEKWLHLDTLSTEEQEETKVEDVPALHLTTALSLSTNKNKKIALLVIIISLLLMGALFYCNRIYLNNVIIVTENSGSQMPITPSDNDSNSNENYPDPKTKERKKNADKLPLSIHRYDLTYYYSEANLESEKISNFALRISALCHLKPSITVEQVRDWNRVNKFLSIDQIDIIQSSLYLPSGAKIKFKIT